MFLSKQLAPSWLFGCASLVVMAICFAQPAAGFECESLVGRDFSKIPEAPSQLTSAKWVAAAEKAPAYCQAKGYITPNIGFEIRLPAADVWNGKLLHKGCGGFCGTTNGFAERCNFAIERGYACIASDMGHQSTPLDGKWAYNNRQAELDFAVRATHVVTVAGKAIVAAAYGRPHRYAYFTGCSTGGRQGMVEAQRFPHDFDGIIAGAPAIHETGAGLQTMWSVLANLDKNHNPILTAKQLPMLNQAALAACDLDDGLKDGIIDDPRRCHFKPADLACSGSSSDTCLTSAQVIAAEKIYRGPENSAGEALYTGGAMPGSELNWTAYVGTRDEQARYFRFIGDLFRYMAFAEDPGPDWQPWELDFDASPDRFGVMEHLYTGSNPDLRRFKRRGGKLILYQGWSDQSVTPLNTVDYYELATRTMGGQDETRDFFRLFMLPGVDHCQGGPGPDDVDYLSYLEAWVENKKAPEALIGKHVENGEVKFTRPIYPYPDRARYFRGNHNDAGSFRRIEQLLH